jgi:PAS domain S-box-containing protein
MIVLTGLEDEALGVQLVEAGAQDYLVKGQVTSHLLTRALRYAIERKRSEEMLRESEVRYRTLIENAPDAISLTDLDGRKRYASQQAAALFGFERAKDVIGLNALELIAPEERGRAAEEMQNLVNLRQGVSGEHEYTFVRRDGSCFPGAVRVALVPDQAGHPSGFINVIRDITERKLVQEALRESERKLRLIAENTTDAIFAYDMNRRLIYVNPAVEELTGYTTAELQDRSFINWLHPEDEARMMHWWEQLFAGKSFKDEEFRIVTRDGQVKWCLSSWGPLRDESGRQIGIQGRERDNTERRRLYQQTREQARDLALLNEVGQLLVSTLDPEIIF